jgi:hypothetical protein
MEEVAKEQLAFTRMQYAEMKPFLQDIATTQVDAQKQQMAQAQNYFDYQQETFRPLEQGLVADAQNFDSEAYRQQQAAQASAASARAFSTTQAMNRRAQAARGVNPNSGAARGANNAIGLQQAASRAQTMTGARQQAEQLAYARRLDAAGLGRGLAGASAAAYGGATSAGTAAGNTAMAAGNQYMQGLNMAGGMMNNVANIQAGTYGQQLGMVGSLVGAGAGIYAAGSDRRLKKNIERVGTDEKTQLPLYKFEYQDWVNQLGTFIGVMSDDVVKRFPNAVIKMENGFDAVIYSMLGITMQKVEDL